MVACLAPRAPATPTRRQRARARAARAGRPGRTARASPSRRLPYGDLRRLEIARALATEPDLLLLDEPFAGLGSGEIEPLVALIRQLHRERRPDDPADRAQAARVHGAGLARHRHGLRRGDRDRRRRDEIVRDPQVDRGLYRSRRRTSMPLLEVDGPARSATARRSRWRACRSRVDAGELVGVLGPNGAGKTTLLKAISRAMPPQRHAGSSRADRSSGCRRTRSSAAASATVPKAAGCFPNSPC